MAMLLCFQFCAGKKMDRCRNIIFIFKKCLQELFSATKVRNLAARKKSNWKNACHLDATLLHFPSRKPITEETAFQMRKVLLKTFHFVNFKIRA